MKDENDMARRIQELGNKLEIEKKEREAEKIKLNKELTVSRELNQHLHEITGTQGTELEELQEKNAELQEVVDRVVAPPQAYGRIVRVYEEDGTVDVDVEGSIKLLTTRPGVNTKALTAGTLVRIDAGTGTVTEQAPFDDVIGDERKLVEFLSESRALVEDKMGHRNIVHVVDAIYSKKVDAGVRVLVTGGFVSEVLDEGNQAALSALSTYALGQSPDMSFDDIAGLDDVVNDVLWDILGPHEYPEGAKKYRLDPGFKYLFYGPPGNGKTSLIIAIAHLIYEKYKTQIDEAKEKHGIKGNLIAIRASELSSKWIGETEERLRAIFEGAAELYQVIKCPVILSIDDCESFLLQRGTSNASTANMDYVTTITSLMEGVKKYPGVCLILTTNRIDLMDSAVVGRMQDMVKYIPPPDTPEKVELIVRKHLRDIPFDDEAIEPLVKRLFDESSENDVLEVQFEDSDSETFPLMRFISGRLLRDVVLKAKKSAFRREAKLPEKERSACRVHAEDLLQALEIQLEKSDTLPTTVVTVREWLRQCGDKRNLFEVNALRDKKKQESREKAQKRIDRAVL